MAIRGPRPPHDVPASAARPAREQAASPLQRLVDFGTAATTVEAKRILGELLASLRAAGFQVAGSGTAEGQLGQALKLFQEQRGLPPTGVLDRETLDALVELGLLPAMSDGANASSESRKVDAPARFEISARPRVLGDPLGGNPRGKPTDASDGARAVRAVEVEQAVERATRDTPADLDLKAFLSSLRAAGFPGAGKGAAQLKSALTHLQRSAGLPQTGLLDRRTADALIRRGIVDERMWPTLSSADGRVVSRPSPAAATEEPTGRMALAGHGHAGVERARAHEPGPTAREGEAGGGSAQPDTAPGGRAGAPGALLEPGRGGGPGDIDHPWFAGDVGNAPAGDEAVDDLRRGHANVDDGAPHDEGAWKVPSLADQVSEGLQGLVRDDDGSGPATYAWDVSLHRPGVYGARQPAPCIFHLVVSAATAFDPLWEEVREALNAKLRAFEPDAAPLDREDIARALQRARYRTR